MPVRIAIGLAVTVVALTIAGRRFFFLYRLVRSGKADAGRFRDVPSRIWAELSEVAGQRKLLKKPVAGLAHAFTMWGFTVLLLTIIEAYGDLFSKTFAIPGIGHSPALGFIEDFFAVAVLVALGVFAVIRLVNSPKRRERASRFYGSHVDAAWVTLGMIAGVMLTLLGYRAAQTRTPGDFPYGHSWWPFASHGIGEAFTSVSSGTAVNLETTLPDPEHRLHHRFPGLPLLLEAPPHRPGSHQRGRVPSPGRPRAAVHDSGHGHGERLRGHRVRCRPHRGLQLETAARHPHLYRVWALPGRLPGLDHGQAPVPQAPHHGLAGQPLRIGSASGGGRSDGADERRGRRGRSHRSGRESRRRADVGARDHRPRCSLVVPHVRSVRGGVSGRHRARRHRSSTCGATRS